MALTAGKLVAFLGLNKKGYTDGLNQADDETKKFTKSSSVSFDKVARAGLIAFTVISGAAIKAVVDAAKFQKQLANVSTMLSKTAMPIMSTFEDQLLEMSQTFGEGTQTLAKGLFDILSASIPASEAMDVLNVSARAARAGLTTTAIAADALTTLINSYGESADSAGFFSDILFQTVKRGKTTFAELAPVIGTVASLAATAGVSAEEFGAALATLTRNGVPTAIAVTNLRAIISSYLKPTDEAIEMSKELGIEFGLAAIQSKGLSGAMNDIAGLAPDVAAKLFPNIRALTGIAVAAKEMKAETELFHEALSKGSPTVEAFDKQTGTLAFKWDQLKATFKVASITIGQELLPTFQKMIERLIEVARFIVDMDAGTKRFIITVAGLVAGLGILTFTLVKVVKGFLAIKQVIVDMKIAIAAMNISLSLTPFGIVLLAVAGLTAGIILLNKAIGDLNKNSQKEKELDEDIIKLKERLINLRGDELIVVLRLTAVKLKERVATLEALKAEDELRMKMQRSRSSKFLDETIEKLAEVRGEQRLLAIQIQLAIEQQKVNTEQRKVAIKALEDEAKALEDAAKATEDNIDIKKKQGESLKKITERQEKWVTEYGKGNDIVQEGIQIDADAGKWKQKWIDLAGEYLFKQKLINEEGERANKKFWAPYIELLKKAAAAYRIKLIPNLKTAADKLRDLNHETIKTKSAVDIALEAWEESKEKLQELKDTILEVINVTTETILSVAGSIGDIFTNLHKGRMDAIEEELEAQLDAFDKERKAAIKAAGLAKKTLDEQLVNLKAELAAETDEKKKEALREQILELENEIALKVINDQYDALAAQAKEDIAADSRRLVHDEAIRQRNLAAFQVVINTASAIIKALVNPGGWAGVGLSIAAGIAGIAQGIVIATTPIPALDWGGFVGKLQEFANGGMFNGLTGTDRNMVALSDGEFVVNKQATAENIDLLEAINNRETNINMSSAPVTMVLNDRVVGEAMIDFIADESDRGNVRINPKAIGES